MLVLDLVERNLTAQEAFDCVTCCEDFESDVSHPLSATTAITIMNDHATSGFSTMCGRGGLCPRGRKRGA